MVLLQDIVGQMHNRVEELRPAVEEFNELTEALASLNGAGVETEPKLSLNEVRAIAGLPPAEAEQPVKRKRGRPKGSGPTRRRILKAVTEEPGITIPEIGRRLHQKSNYFYKALPAMEEDGLVYQSATTGGWHPALSPSEYDDPSPKRAPLPAS